MATWCVFCASADGLPERYQRLAAELGTAIGRRGHGLVYGGGSVGLMGIVAQATQAAGGEVTGVIPVRLREWDLAWEQADRLLVTDTVRERKQRMEDAADGFIALPGGVGTLEEMLEIIALKQLRYHTKPVVWLDAFGYFDPILAQLHRAVDEGFAQPSFRMLYEVCRSVDEAMDYLAGYVPDPEAARPMGPGPLDAGPALEAMP